MDDNFTQGGRDLLDDTVRQCIGSGSLVCPGANGSTSANTPSSSTSNSTTPNTEPGKQQIHLNNQDYPGSPRVHCKVTSNNKSSVTNSTNGRPSIDQPSINISSGRRRGNNQTSDLNFAKTNSGTRVCPISSYLCKPYFLNLLLLLSSLVLDTKLKKCFTVSA